MVLKGPKGVDKSAALGALAHLCQRPHIVVSVPAGSSIFVDYVKEVVKKYDGK